MKVLKEDDNSFVIYFFDVKEAYSEEDKPQIIKIVKDVVLRANQIYRLNLKGFYKVRVYLNKKIGFVIEIINVDDISLNHALDLRVLVYFDQDFYIEVDNFDFLPNQKKIVCVNNKYYINADSLSKNEMISLLELGNVIYKTDLIDNFYLGKIITN